MRIIAIDGPAGAGKSTVARRVAETLGYFYLDTGALYRAIALHLLKHGVSVESSRDVTLALSKIDLRLDPAGKLFLNGRDVTGDLRSREVTEAVSSVASLPAVRRHLLTLQKAIGSGGGIDPRPDGIVAEGRDIGTVVFPGTPFKFFLVASLEVRAKRRENDFRKGGERLPLEKVMDEIRRRDEKDSQRAISPLRKAPDAVEIDTSSLSVDETVQAILERLPNP